MTPHQKTSLVRFLVFLTVTSSDLGHSSAIFRHRQSPLGFNRRYLSIITGGRKRSQFSPSDNVMPSKQLYVMIFMQSTLSTEDKVAYTRILWLNAADPFCSPLDISKAGSSSKELLNEHFAQVF